ncbi:MAG: hypothetical protein L6R42_000493 [Xanthoria sp. 1 TBL-2021]|nr:MAG: hypothetical protein L6R42_000493 [Xanthoria sp. 1 TBL-2021]
MNELSSMRETASDEDGYELTPLLGDGDEDDNISIQSSEPDAPLGSDHGDVESPGLGLIFLITLFSKSWFWRRLILVAASVSSIVASGLIINCLLHVSRPGPWSYYNLFPGALASAFLLLECIEIPWMRLQLKYGNERTAKTGDFDWGTGMTGIFYWGALGVLNLVSAGAWYLARKIDLVVIFILGFFLSFPSVSQRFIYVEDHFRVQFGRTSGPYLGLIQILHLLFMFLFFIGGMDTWTSNHRGSGLPYKVRFDDGITRIIHVLCKEAKGSNEPTIWFEAGQDRGTLWTSSLQSVLLNTYNRSSCSYDNPSNGPSDPASIHFTNSSSYWPSLLRQLGKKDELFIGIGWGSGTEDVLAHASQTPSLVKGVVVMDTYPAAIEWMESAQKNNWTDVQLMEERQRVLTAQIKYERQRMMFGISWTSALYTYYDYDYEKGVEYTKDMQRRFKTQLTENIFTYYSLLKKRAQPVPNTMPKPNLSATIPVFGIIHNNTRPRDSASNAFRRKQQELMVARIAGGQEKVKGMAWCSADNCTDPLPLYNVDWLASTIVGFGI